ncbi:MAG: hypothetical protein JNM42_12885 [Propionivibrio sp.]|uniref:hypothetical protein n=1 Tax=Propionivibrio sp. TaxID=2212460 RepID=UPI001A55B2CD|nr:hypothetical protein [Propionivibrio sp.]MBL8415325.1 hypothetical protein [Propionivibrio sp.]
MNTNQRRVVLKQIAASALLGSSGIGGLLRDALANATKPVTPGMYTVKGMVTINGKPAVPGMAIGAEDSIITGTNSEAIYVIGQDAFLQRASSTVSFSGASADVMRVFSGKILSVFGKGSKKLETATATIGIRGTGCYIESEARRVYFCLCYGVAEVIPLADTNHVEIIETRYHDHPLYIHESSRPMMVDAPVMNHSDQELKLLESLVGRWPPFSQDTYRY